MILPEVIIRLENWELLDSAKGYRVVHKTQPRALEWDGAVRNSAQVRSIGNANWLHRQQRLESSLRKLDKRSTISRAAFREYDQRREKTFLALLLSFAYLSQQLISVLLTSTVNVE